MPSVTFISEESNYWPPDPQVIKFASDLGNDVISTTDDTNVYNNFNNFLNYNDVDSGLLPPGLRLSIPGFLIFERPPTRKLVQYLNYTLDQLSEEEYEQEEDGYPESVAYEIPIPWQLYLVAYSTHPHSKYRVTQVSTFFMNTPLISMDTVLYSPYVHNFFTNGVLCSPMFDNSWEINRYPQNLAGVIASAYDWVWNTGFNADLHECIDQTYSQRLDNHIIKSLKEYLKENPYKNFYHSFYQKLSEYSPEDVVSLPWANVSYCMNHDQDLSYIWSNDLVDHHYPDFSHDEETQAAKYVYFKNTVDHPSSIVKTYSDIINYTFFNPSQDEGRYVRNYSQFLNKSNNTFSSIENFAYQVRQHISLNP